MPAISDKQRKFMGAVMALKKGTLKGKPSAKLKEAAGSMSEKQVGDFMHVRKDASAQHAILKQALSEERPFGVCHTAEGTWRALGAFFKALAPKMKPMSGSPFVTGSLAAKARNPYTLALALSPMVGNWGRDKINESMARKYGVDPEDMKNMSELMPFWSKAWGRQPSGSIEYRTTKEIGEAVPGREGFSGKDGTVVGGRSDPRLGMDRRIEQHRRSSDRNVPAANSKANLITASLLLGLLGIGAGSVWADRRRIAQIKRMQQLEPEAVAGVEESMRRLDEAEQRRGRNRYEDLKAAGQLDL